MIGIIGGTGLYKIEGISQVETRNIETPFGAPSAPVTTGMLEGRPVAFLPRHGASHQILPSEINFRANIWALKAVGVSQIVSVSAVGSLTREIVPGDLAIPNQYMDFTKGRRAGTFFGDGIVAHVSTAEPSCPGLTNRLRAAGTEQGTSFHTGTTYACVEGPRLGTRAESHFLRTAGAQLVGMTNVPEAFLAREAQLCYCTVAVVTDFDCWLEDPAAHASVEKVIALYSANVGRVQNILAALMKSEQDLLTCSCQTSLRHAVLTAEHAMNTRQLAILNFLRDDVTI